MKRPLGVVLIALASATLLDMPPFGAQDALSFASAQTEYRIDGAQCDLSKGLPSGTGVLDAYLTFQKRCSEPEYQSEVLPEFITKQEEPFIPVAVWPEAFDTNIISLPAAYDIPAPTTTWLLGTCVFGMVLIRRSPTRKAHASW